jgi:hypothetical protein
MVLSGIIAGVVFMNLKKKAQTKISQMSLQQDKASAAGMKAIEIAKKNSSKVKKLGPEALRYAEEAAKLAFSVLGEDVRSRMIPPEPEYKMPEIKAPGVPGTGVDGTNTMASAADVAEDVAVDAVPEAMPAGEMPREDDHPVVTTVRSMYMDAYAVKLAGIVADHMVAELEVDYKRIESMKTTASRDNTLQLIAELLLSTEEMGKIANEMGTKVNK